MSNDTRYSIDPEHYDGRYSIGTHVEDLHDEGGPTDGPTINEITGESWTDGGRTEAQELLDLGGSVVNVFGLDKEEPGMDIADAWLRAHESGDNGDDQRKDSSSREDVA